jgi:hypothetical protein
MEPLRLPRPGCAGDGSAVKRTTAAQRKMRTIRSIEGCLLEECITSP